jgi:hypothetical protein
MGHGDAAPGAPQADIAVDVEVDGDGDVLSHEFLSGRIEVAADPYEMSVRRGRVIICKAMGSKRSNFLERRAVRT